MKEKVKHPIKKHTDRYDILVPMLNGLLDEVKELSKKKQNDPLNNLKIERINKVLRELKEIMSEYGLGEFLDILDTNDVPTNSDAVLIMSQYRAAASIFREKYYGYVPSVGEHTWQTQELGYK